MSGNYGAVSGIDPSNLILGGSMRFVSGIGYYGIKLTSKKVRVF